MKKLLFISLVIISLFITQMSIVAQTRFISYQGNILDQQEKPFVGTHQMTFEMYDREFGGNQIWSEIQNVAFFNGYFNVYLGSTTPFNQSFNFNREIWLQVTVGNSVPYTRTNLTMVPSSFYAEKSGLANMADSVGLKSIRLENLSDQVIMMGGDLTGSLPNPRIRAGALLESIAEASLVFMV